MGQTARMVVVYSMPLVAVMIAFLMVSRTPYRRFHRTYFLGKKPFGHVITFVIFLAVFWSFKAPTLLLLVLWYAASGPVFYLVRVLSQPKAASLKKPSDVSEPEAERRHA